MSFTASPAPSRLFFLDWVRILAFFVLILYHVGMYYVSWDWHVKSEFASATLEPYMQLSAPWRLGLLFLVSGVASRFLLAKAGATAFMRQRSARLLIPLLFGMLVIVPPQAYFEVVKKLAYTGSYAEFMGLYLTGYGGFCREDCLIMPTWNHLWFVAVAVHAGAGHAGDGARPALRWVVAPRGAIPDRLEDRRAAVRGTGAGAHRAAPAL
jgi:hypothetical protein